MPRAKLFHRRHQRCLIWALLCVGSAAFSESSVAAAPNPSPGAGNPPTVSANVPPDANSVDAGTYTQPHSSLGDEPIRGSTGATEVSARSGPEAPSQSGGPDYYRVLASLALVLGIIFLLRWLSRFFFPTAAGHNSRAIEVVSRTPLTTRQQLMLVRVGKRLILVGESGSQMNALCEITDPDEIATLVGQLRDEQDRSAVSSKSFSTAFRRFRGQHAEVAPEADAAQEVSGIELVGGSQEVSEQTVIASTRDELTGLMDRVRSLKRRFAGGQ